MRRLERTENSEAERNERRLERDEPKKEAKRKRTKRRLQRTEQGVGSQETGEGKLIIGRERRTAK